MNPNKCFVFRSITQKEKICYQEDYYHQLFSCDLAYEAKSKDKLEDVQKTQTCCHSLYASCVEQPEHTGRPVFLLKNGLE